MELHWTLCPNLTNTRLLSSGIIWFWSQANIPWLDFIIDSARAVKVSQSPGTQRCARLRAHADLQQESGTQSNVIFSEGIKRTRFRNWYLEVFVVSFFSFFFNIFQSDWVCLHTLHFTFPAVTVAFTALWRQNLAVQSRHIMTIQLPMFL